MPTKQQIITIGVLCVVALGLGYWSGMPEKDSGERAEVVAPTIITNVVTNTLREVVTNIVRVLPPVKPNPVIEAYIRYAAKKPTGELTKADLEKVTRVYLENKNLTDVKGLENLTQLTHLFLPINQLTSVKGLENLTKLEVLYLSYKKLNKEEGLEKLKK